MSVTGCIEKLADGLQSKTFMTTFLDVLLRLASEFVSPGMKKLIKASYVPTNEKSVTVKSV